MPSNPVWVIFWGGQKQPPHISEHLWTPLEGTSHHIWDVLRDTPAMGLASVDTKPMNKGAPLYKYKFSLYQVRLLVHLSQYYLPLLAAALQSLGQGSFLFTENVRDWTCDSLYARYMLYTWATAPPCRYLATEISIMKLLLDGYIDTEDYSLRLVVYFFFF